MAENLLFTSYFTSLLNITPQAHAASGIGTVTAALSLLRSLSGKWVPAKWRWCATACSIYNIIHTHTYSWFTALCPGLPGWAGTRRDIHPLTPEMCCGCLSSFWILWGMGKITEASVPTIRLVTTPSGPSMPPPPSSPQFYADKLHL